MAMVQTERDELTALDHEIAEAADDLERAKAQRRAFLDVAAGKPGARYPLVD